ncbi:MAG: RDD family protein [Chitinophagaceae bacterium]|nr:RDD family protein [Chitinophagaceae bacterium]
MTEENVDLLTGMEIRLVRASHGKRFVNALIDMIVLNIIVVIVYAMIELLAPGISLWLNSDSTAGAFTSLLINILLFGGGMALIEIAGKGRSLGKLITGTRAVQEDGSPITAADAFSRSFIRLVPFEVFSALGSPCYPWHDKWSKTYVVDIKESMLT